jgi:hypothetical protein
MLNAQLILTPWATRLAAAIARCCANSALTISIDGTAIITLGDFPAGPEGGVLAGAAVGMLPDGFCIVAGRLGIFNLPFFIFIL